MSLPTGLVLEGEELTGKERKVLWVLLGLELTRASVCSRGLQGASRHAGFILSQWFMNQGVIRKRKNKEGRGGGGYVHLKC